MAVEWSHGCSPARVIPILLRPVDWHGTPFAKLQVLPANAQPITTWKNLDSAFANIAIEIRRVVDELKAPHLKDYNSDLQGFSGDTEHNLINVVREPEESFRHRSTSQPDFHIIEHFRLWQKKVEELKSIHNMLHEIERSLAVLTATIQLISKKMEKKKGFSVWLPPNRNDKLSKSDLDHIEIMWRETVLKIEELEYFAKETMKVLDDERFYFDDDVVKGPLWITELFFLQQSLESSIKIQDKRAIERLSDDLLIKCRAHLYRIDKRLLDALKELDRASDILVKHTT